MVIKNDRGTKNGRKENTKKEKEEDNVRMKKRGAACGREFHV